MSSSLQFKPAVRNLVQLKSLIIGPSGGGKTLGAQGIGACQKIALADSENDRSLYYADREKFNHLSLPDRSTKTYMTAIDNAVAAGFEVLIIDSLTHACQDILRRQDAFVEANPKQKFVARAIFGAEWQKLLDHILSAPIHIIATARSKQTYEKVEGSGKVEKLGLQPILRDGAEFEFALVFDLTQRVATRYG